MQEVKVKREKKCLTKVTGAKEHKIKFTENAVKTEVKGPFYDDPFGLVSVASFSGPISMSSLQVVFTIQSPKQV